MPSVPSITLLLKGTSEPNKVPMVSALRHKELAINYNDGLLFSLNSDNTIATYLNSSRLPYLLSATLSSAAPQYGGNTLGNNGTNGAILGGTNNTLNHENSFILGTNITSTEANYTYTNNLSASGTIKSSAFYGSSLEINSDQPSVLYVNLSGVGIGTESPTSKLHISGGYATSDVGFQVPDGGSGGTTITDGSLSTNNITFNSTGKSINDGYYRGSAAAATYSINPATQTAIGITVTGASLGDFAIPSVNVSTEGLLITASVTATNSVAVILRNDTASNITLTTATVKALVIK